MDISVHVFEDKTNHAEQTKTQPSVPDREAAHVKTTIKILASIFSQKEKNAAPNVSMIPLSERLGLSVRIKKQNPIVTHKTPIFMTFVSSLLSSFLSAFFLLVPYPCVGTAKWLRCNAKARSCSVKGR